MTDGSLVSAFVRGLLREIREQLPDVMDSVANGPSGLGGGEIANGSGQNIPNLGPSDDTLSQKVVQQPQDDGAGCNAPGFDASRFGHDRSSRLSEKPYSPAVGTSSA